MEPLPLTGEELVERNLAEKRVAEFVRTSRSTTHRCPRPWHPDENLPVDHLAQGDAELVGRDREHFAQEAVIDGSTTDRRNPEHLARSLRQLPHPRPEDIAESWRKLRTRAALAGLAVRSHCLPVAIDGKELLDEERVAIGPFDERIDDLVARRAIQRRCHEDCNIGPPERTEFDSFYTVAPLQLGKVGQDRMAATNLVAPRGEDDHHRVVAESADEEREEVPRRSVGPLKVFHDEHERV